jgi:hypothetical protein
MVQTEQSIFQADNALRALADADADADVRSSLPEFFIVLIGLEQQQQAYPTIQRLVGGIGGSLSILEQGRAGMKVAVSLQASQHD